MDFLSSISDSKFFKVLCDYACWILDFNGASRLLWLSLIWLILEFVTRLIARKNVNPVENFQFAEVRDEGSWWLITLSSLILSLLIISVLHFQWKPDLPNYLFPIGVILMVLGILFRAWAVISLGKFFTMKVMIFSNHSLVEEGPYRLVRHPSYLGALITTIGFGLASGYSVLLIIFFLIVALALGYRILIEERVLKEKFGEEWDEYSRRTYRLIPWVF